MFVKAAAGMKCPKEGKHREYIDDKEGVEVPDDSAFYNRLIDDGSLVRVKPKKLKEADNGK